MALIAAPANGFIHVWSRAVASSEVESSSVLGSLMPWVMALSERKTTLYDFVPTEWSGRLSAPSAVRPKSSQ